MLSILSLLRLGHLPDVSDLERVDKSRLKVSFVGQALGYDTGGSYSSMSNAGADVLGSMLRTFLNKQYFR